MANFPSWKSLNPKQRKLALERWHQRKDGDAPAQPNGDARRAAYLAEEVVPGTGLTRGELIKSTKAATQIKYGETQQQLAHQPARINDWFSQYQNAIKGATAAQAAASAQAVQGVQNLQQGLDSAAAAQWAGQQKQMTDDAQLRGATTDPGLADVAHNASNVRNALTGSYGAMLLSQGANEGTYLNQRGVNANLGRIEQLKQNAGARQALAKEKGAFRVSYRDQLKSGASDAALKAELQKSLLTDRAADNVRADKSLNSSIRNTKIDNRRAGSQWRNTLNKYGFTNGEWAHMSNAERAAARKTARPTPKPPAKPDPVTGPGSLTPTKEHEYVSQIRTIADYFKNPPTKNVLGADGKPTGETAPMSRDEIIAMLKSGKNPLRKAIDVRVINIAQSLYRHNGRGIDGRGVRNAHDLGIHVNGNFKVVHGKGKPKPDPAIVDAVGNAVGDIFGRR